MPSPFKAAIDMFFVVQPLEWSVQERYPIGAVIGVLPKYPLLRLTEQILAIQHKLPQSPNYPKTTASSRVSAPSLSPSSKPHLKANIGIRSQAGRCHSTFSVETKKNYFTVAVHICNVFELVSNMDEYKKMKRFCKWSASHSVLPEHVVQACDFSENSAQEAITVMFKVEGKLSTAVTTRKNVLAAQLSEPSLLSIQETVVKCNTILDQSDIEDVLMSLRKDHLGDKKLYRGTAMSFLDALAILYSTAEKQHRTRHGHDGYPLLEMASYEYPETEKMVNELLTMANSEAAKMIAKKFQGRALLVTQLLPDHSKEKIAQEFSSSLALFPAVYKLLTSEGQTAPKPAQNLTGLHSKTEGTR